MKISYEKINELLRVKDIESLLELGAPSDEYSSEAEAIFEALQELEETSEDRIAETISSVWMQSFGLSLADMQKRNPAIRTLANHIARDF